MAKVRIDIATDGSVSLARAQSGKDQVYWKAVDPNQTWYIRFYSPFADDVVVNDNGGGESKPKKVGMTVGYFSYTVSNTPALQLSKRKKTSLAVGGIIIDP